MSNNKNLNKAQKVKNDEFYTPYDHIEEEVMAFYNHDNKLFDGKIVFLPCDDWEWSNFVKFFENNFEKFGIKRLIATCYNPAVRGMFNQSDDWPRGKVYVKDKDNIRKGQLKGNGDFRSDECIKLRDYSDIIFTNPPFSLYRDFQRWCMKSRNKFAFISHVTGLAYPTGAWDIIRNKMWIGSTKLGGGQKYHLSNGGTGKVPTVWLTNIPHGIKPSGVKNMKTMAENKSKYGDKYPMLYKDISNGMGIEVSSVKMIPSDYNGKMAVPITYLDKHDPGQFELLDYRQDKCVIDGKEIFARYSIKRKT